MSKVVKLHEAEVKRGIVYCTVWILGINWCSITSYIAEQMKIEEDELKKTFKKKYNAKIIPFRIFDKVDSNIQFDFEKDGQRAINDYVIPRLVAVRLMGKNVG
jgi:pantothenate kinase-related protein Tda10